MMVEGSSTPDQTMTSSEKILIAIGLDHWWWPNALHHQMKLWTNDV
jgi:hypothetical protein